MNRGVLERLPVDQMMAGSYNWWNINNMRPPSQQGSSFMVPNPSNLLPQYYIPPPQSVSSSWDDNQDQLPESQSQLLMGGMVGDETQKSGMSDIQNNYKKGMENWEEQLLQQPPSNRSMSMGDAKQENSARGGHDMFGHENGEFSCVKRSWSAQMMPVSSPTSSVTSLSSNNMLDFSGNKSDGRHLPPDRSSECNSKATCGVQKKARVQTSSNQPTFKVRKEKLGDRVTALHQLVSPFGKTDTASVLSEAIGYIRFLQGQIEALSLPYLANKSRNVGKPQQHVHGERNCLFPEDPGQLLNDGCKKRKGTVLEKDSQEEQNKDLKSRGLCLVPISCTQVGSDSAADYWAPDLGGGGGACGGF